MQHKKFFILLFIIGVPFLISAISFTYLTLTHGDIGARIGLKTVPICLLSIPIIVYFIIYRITIYSLFTLFALFFCLVGDILLALYDPMIIDMTDIGATFYFIVGGVFFFLARLVLSLNFMLKPWKEINLIKYSLGRFLLVHGLASLPSTVFAILIGIYIGGFVGWSVAVYVFLGFSVPFSFSILRLNCNTLNNESSTESFLSQFLGVMAIALFNISDTLLIVGMFFSNRYDVVLLSDNIYWISMYFLTASIVRTDSEVLERGEYLTIYTIQTSADVEEGNSQDY